MPTVPIKLHLTQELIDCLHEARDGLGLAPYIEQRLRKDRAVQKARKELGITIPPRPTRADACQMARDAKSKIRQDARDKMN